jgi:hypothetical protein
MDDFEGRNPSEWALSNEDCEQEWLRSLAEADQPGLAVEGWITMPARAFPGEREALVPVAERLLKSVLDFVTDGGDR